MLPALLPARPASAWARALLAPLMTNPRRFRRIHAVLPTALELPRATAASALWVERHTVTRHLERAQALLGLDLRDLSTRAAVDLALRILESVPAWPAPAGAPRLEHLLHIRSLQRHWRMWLAPVAAAGPELLPTARAWLLAGASAHRTAEALGVERHTVRARLRDIEEILCTDPGGEDNLRPGLDSLATQRDLMAALHLLPDPRPALPAPAARPRLPAPRRHTP